MTDCPDMEYFMNEDKSDVVFIVEGQRVPALKQLLIERNKVFRAMFSDNFKESKDKTVVIEETSFEAFQTLILFLYSDRHVFKDEKDIHLIVDVFVLSDRYEAIGLMRKTIEMLSEIEMTFDNFELISRIVFRYNIRELMAKVMTFIDNNFSNSVKKDIKQLCELNDSTNDRLFEVNANHYYIKVNKELFENKKYFKHGKCEHCQIVHFDYLTHFHWIDRKRYFYFICKICNREVPVKFDL